MLVTTHEEWFMSLTHTELLELYRTLSRQSTVYMKVKAILEQIEELEGANRENSEWPHPRS